MVHDDMTGFTPKPDSPWLSETGVRARGWTPAMVAAFLGEPDRTVPNPHYRTSSPMKLYAKTRVEAAESDPNFREEQAKADARSMAARAAATTRSGRRAALATSAPVRPPLPPERKSWQFASDGEACSVPPSAYAPPPKPVVVARPPASPVPAPVARVELVLPNGYRTIDYDISVYLAGARVYHRSDGVVSLRGRAATPLVPTRGPWRRKNDAERQAAIDSFWAAHGTALTTEFDALVADVAAYETACLQLGIQPFPPDVRNRLKGKRRLLDDQRAFVTALLRPGALLARKHREEQGAAVTPVKAPHVGAPPIAKIHPPAPQRPKPIRGVLQIEGASECLPQGFRVECHGGRVSVVFFKTIAPRGCAVGARLPDGLDTASAFSRRVEAGRAKRLTAFWATHGTAAVAATDALMVSVTALLELGRTHGIEAIAGRDWSALASTNTLLADQVTLVSSLDAALRVKVRRRGAADAVRARVTLSDYAATFPAASRPRKFIALLGPTNSGKTHRAFTRLSTAASGLYLAPLRLLALEGYARLNAEFSAPCDLVTGEEHRETLGARFVSSTVEMCDPHRRVEVAVVDEVQMLGDRERGWAWTQALAGARADEVWCLGSPSAEPALRALADRLGVPITVETTERLGPLQMEDRPLSPDPWKALDAVRPGDALIVFSRRDALRLRDDLLARGRTVACIYGALSPEVREREAARFARGDATVLVATDAIGMGLNLPIKRVVFTAVEKFDGEKRIDLPRAMVQQIAGRAGRHGFAGAGLVAGLTHGEHGYVANQLRGFVQPLATTGFGVAPTIDHLRAIEDASGESSLAMLLELFTRHVTTDGFFSPAVTDDQRLRAAWFDEGGPRDLSLADRHTLSLVPMSTRDDYAVALWQTWCRDLARGTPATLVFARGSEAATQVSMGRAEALVQALGGYTWLARRRPDIFPAEDEAHALAREWSAVVEEHLRSPRPQGDGSGSYRGLPGWYWMPRGYQPPRRHHREWEEDAEDDDELYD